MDWTLILEPEMKTDWLSFRILCVSLKGEQPACFGDCTISFPHEDGKMLGWLDHARVIPSFYLCLRPYQLFLTVFKYIF